LWLLGREMFEIFAFNFYLIRTYIQKTISYRKLNIKINKVPRGPLLEYIVMETLPREWGVARLFRRLRF